MKEIPLNTWNRRPHFEWFSSFSNPSLNVSAQMDVTETVEYCRLREIPFFPAAMYILCRSANALLPFRLRVLGGKVWEIPFANASYTESAGDIYLPVRAQSNVSFSEFEKTVRKNKEDLSRLKEVENYNEKDIVDDFYFSCIPWADFTSVQQPVPDRIENNCIPRILWTRYVNENGALKMSVHVCVNHALVDGKDVADFVNLAREGFANPASILE